MKLNADTMYFRADHPKGMIFEAGVDAPGEDWSESAGTIKAVAAPDYECTTLKAFAELVRSERESAGSAIAEVARLRGDLAEAEAGLRFLMDRIRQLESAADKDA